MNQDFYLINYAIRKQREHSRNAKGGRWVLNNINHGANTTTTTTTISTTTSPKEQKPLARRPTSQFDVVILGEVLSLLGRR